MHGLYILAGPGVDSFGRRDAHWSQVAPTLCRLLALPLPEGVAGAALV
jgi:hypothetical protein